MSIPNWKKSQDLYWSKEVYLKRIENWKLDIKHARLVFKHSGAASDRDIVTSLVMGLKTHKLCYKIRKIYEERKDDLF